MGFKKWQVSEIDKQLAKELAEECDVDPIVALIASSRGYSDPMELEQFLSDEPVFSDPRETADIIIAAEIVNAAIEDGRKIAIYGDYDCDGVCATSLLYQYLRTRNSDCFYYIPDRFSEGYGMNMKAVDKIAEMGAELIITVDNGISAIEEIAYAKKKGMDVVLTDHHLPGEILPDADAVVDPHRKDCPSTFKEICGTQVAFRLICVMENKEPEELLPYFADILSLAVLADIMPLIYENRSIVKYGVHKLKNSPLTGLSALMSVAGLEQRGITSSKIAFGLAPRINAAGRMGDAARAVELLCSDNMMTALGFANEVDGENSLRQQIEKKISAEAVEIIEKNGYKNDRVIICAGKGWHHGVVGIVAARITERYGKPSILISSGEDEFAHGSGRSIEGFSLFTAINSCADLLVKFGGHDQAAGITVKTENIDALRKRINEYADNLPYVAPVLNIDCRLNAAALTVDLASYLKTLEPFGLANPLPLFGLYGVTLQRITPIANGKHLRLIFSKDTTSFSALLFGVTPDAFCFEVGNVMDLAVNIEENVYKGETNISVKISALRMSGTDDRKLFEDLSLWEDFLNGYSRNFLDITPERPEVGTVYKFLCEKAASEDKLKYNFINTLGLGKTLAALKILTELGLVRLNDKGLYEGIKVENKTDLLNSETYKKLMKGVEQI